MENPLLGMLRARPLMLKNMPFLNPTTHCHYDREFKKPKAI